MLLQALTGRKATIAPNIFYHVLSSEALSNWKGDFFKPSEMLSNDDVISLVTPFWTITMFPLGICSSFRETDA